MYKYALATQIENEEYEVFDVIRFPENATSSINRIESAVNSGYPMIGMKTTQFGYSVVHDAEWDGSSFSGGNENFYANSPEADWNFVDTFSVICNNKIILIMFHTKNTSGNEMYNAAFEQNVIMLKIKENEDISLGYIWNGSEFRSPN